MTDIPSYGLIVEGPYDQAFYQALIPRISNATVHATLVCGGIANLMKRFPALLRGLEYRRHGQPVDKALVIRDSKGADAETPRAQMQNKIKGRAYSFPRGVQLCVVCREMETWLLADIEAINAVARDRGGRDVSAVVGGLEEIEDPKRCLRSFLSQARILYTAPVCAEIASRARLETLEYGCPSFRRFRQQVIDC